MNNYKPVYTVEILGENNTFTIEATAGYDPVEDWITGRVSYQTYVDTATLVHGNRRRDVTDLLTNEQQEQIVKEIDRCNLADKQEYEMERALNARQAEAFFQQREIDRIGRFR